MSIKRNTKIAATGNFVNLFATVAVIGLIAAGYIGAISDLPVTI